MKIKEIKSSLSATVPIGAYENLKPGFEMTVELADGDSAEAAFKHINGYLKTMLESFSNNAKADLIAKQYAGIRFYDKDGKKYPSVTSILGWDIDWKISEDELQQYGARGTIIHKLIENYLASGKWIDMNNIPELEKEIATVTAGSLALSIVDCSYEKAIESILPDLKVIKQEHKLFNNEHLYAGRTDLLGMYKGKKSIIDFKTGTTTDMRQLAAYAVCEEGVEQLVIVPVGPTENKTGIKKPVISTDIQGEFKKFLYARSKFRERFGI